MRLCFGALGPGFFHSYWRRVGISCALLIYVRFFARGSCIPRCFLSALFCFSVFSPLRSRLFFPFSSSVFVLVQWQRGWPFVQVCCFVRFSVLRSDGHLCMSLFVVGRYMTCVFCLIVLAFAPSSCKCLFSAVAFSSFRTSRSAFPLLSSSFSAARRFACGTVDRLPIPFSTALHNFCNISFCVVSSLSFRSLWRFVLCFLFFFSLRLRFFDLAWWFCALGVHFFLCLPESLSIVIMSAEHCLRHDYILLRLASSSRGRPSALVPGTSQVF